MERQEQGDQYCQLEQMLILGVGHYSKRSQLHCSLGDWIPNVRLLVPVFLLPFLNVLIFISFLIWIKSKVKYKSKGQKKQLSGWISLWQIDEVTKIFWIADLFQKPASAWWSQWSCSCFCILCTMCNVPVFLRLFAFLKSLPTSFLPYKICFTVHQWA